MVTRKTSWGSAGVPYSRCRMIAPVELFYETSVGRSIAFSRATLFCEFVEVMMNRYSRLLRGYPVSIGLFAGLAVCLVIGCDQVGSDPVADDLAMDSKTIEAPTVADNTTSSESIAPETAAPETAAPESAAPGDDTTDSIADDSVQEMDDVEESMDEWGPDGETTAERAAKAFDAPPNAKRLSKDGRLWIDVKRQRVYIDGYVAMTRGPLEMFACPAGTKEHESIVAVLARSREVHAALLAINATPGTPVRFRPDFSPPTGQVIRVYACWYDKEGAFQTIDARKWIQDLETEKAMDADWVFAGSGFWEDPQDKVEHYQADSGDMICVSNFASAMLDVAMPSSSDADSLRFIPYESEIPERETPVRLVLVPVPIPTDNADSGTSEQQNAGDESRPNSVKNILELPVESDVPRQT